MGDEHMQRGIVPSVQPYQKIRAVFENMNIFLLVSSTDLGPARGLKLRFDQIDRPRLSA
jgi:hypothetical protein